MKIMHISFSRTLLDSAFENEAKCKSETEAAKREVMRLSDKLEQVTSRLSSQNHQQNKTSNAKTG